MAMVTFKGAGDQHIKEIKPKHYKYRKYMLFSISINILLLLTTILMKIEKI